MQDDTRTYHDSGSPFIPGQQLAGRYQILEMLGLGGMGFVYHARDLELNVDVALKVLRPEILSDSEAVERFKQEVILARRISHRNVVRTYDIGDIQGWKYLSMSYVAGKSLKEILRQGPLEVDRAIALFRQIAEAVQAAHAEEIIHRDLKPSNILVGEGDQLFVTDFGIAKSLKDPQRTHSGMLLGTPAYLAPEQMHGQTADKRSDIYALGLILYEMLSGHPAAGLTNLEKTLKRKQPHLPEYLTHVIDRCLEPDPEMRYPSVNSLLGDLDSKAMGRRSLHSLIGKRYLAGALLALLAVLVGYFLGSHILTRTEPAPERQSGSQALPSGPSLLVLPFTNQSGREDLAWLQAALADLLINELSQDPKLRVVSAQRVFQILEDLKVGDELLDQSVVRRLFQILDADHIVQGGFTQAGSPLRIDVHIIGRYQPEEAVYLKAAGTQDDLFRMVDELADQTRQRLGMRGEPDGLSPETGISVYSLRAFSLGHEYLRRGDHSRSSQYFLESIQESPNFLRAFLDLSRSYERQGNREEAIEVLRKALEIRNSEDARTHDLIQAQYSLLRGDQDEAIRLYERLAQDYPNDPDLRFDLALAYERKGDMSQAISILQELTQLDPSHAQAYFHLGKNTILAGNAEEAIGQFLVRALSLYTQMNNEHGQAEVLNAMGVAYERLGRYDDAIRYYNDSIHLKEKIGDKRGTATSLSNIAKIHIFRGNYEKAIPIMDRTLKIFEDIRQPTGVADVLNSFGVLRERQGHYPEALKYYKRALQVRKEIGNQRLIAQSYDNVGYVYYLLGQHDNAYVYWQQAFDLKREIGDESGIVLTLQNMGFLQLAQGQLDQALKSFLDALDRSRAIKYENATAVSLGNLGAMAQYQGRYSAALDYYREAIVLLEKLQDRAGLAEYHRLLASALIELGSYSEAEKELAAAHDLGQEAKSAEVLAGIQLLFARLQRLKGNLPEAAGWLEKARQNAGAQVDQKLLVQVQLEKSLLDLAENRPTPEGVLRRTAAKAGSIGNVWILLEAHLAAAAHQSENKAPGSAIDWANRGLSLAQTIGARPYLYHFHRIAGQAYSALKDSARSQEHLRKATTHLEAILKSTPESHLANFKSKERVKEMESLLSTLSAR